MLAQIPIERRDSLRARFESHGCVLLNRLQHLYGKHPHFEEWFIKLLTRVAITHANRSTELLALDIHRETNPNWFTQQSMLGYCAYVDRFAGTLQGINQKIDHLSELGVSYLHLLPFLRARAGDNDGGFAVASYDEIEPRFGDMQDLRDLTANLRLHGISLCSDFVLNHVADDHPWACAAKAGSSKELEYFYTYADRTEPDVFERDLGQIFPQAAPGNFTFEPNLQRWVWTTFYPYQWDLNYTNPAVFEEMALALLALANNGVEVFRLDSTAFLWKRAGTNCMNQVEAHWILQALRSIVDIAAPGVLLKAEAIVPTAELPAYLGNKNPSAAECHLAYHSSLMAASWGALAEQNCDLLYNVMEATPTLPEHTSWLTYIRCHDDIGWNVIRPEASQKAQNAQQRLQHIAQFYAGAENSFANGASFQASDANAVHGTNGMSSALTGYARAKTPNDTELAQRRLLLLYGVSFCFGGMPLIYMGDELAQANHELYAIVPEYANDSRWLQRPFLDESSYATRHDKTTVSGNLFLKLCHFLALRRTLPMLAATASRSQFKHRNPALLTFFRDDANADGSANASADASTTNRLLFVGNFSEKTQRFSLQELGICDSDESWLDQLTNKSYADSIEIEPWSQYWLTKKITNSN